ncbi:MAG: hypothetical protein AB7W16_27260 [Candidatus Obscuribacterales bacterium]
MLIQGTLLLIAMLLASISPAHAGLPLPAPATPEIDAGLLALVGTSISAAIVVVRSRKKS